MVLTLEAALVLDLGGHVSPVLDEVVGVDWGGEGRYLRWRLLWSWILVATLAQCLMR